MIRIGHVDAKSPKHSFEERSILIRRLVGSDLRAWRRFPTDYGQTESNRITSCLPTTQPVTPAGVRLLRQRRCEYAVTFGFNIRDALTQPEVRPSRQTASVPRPSMSIPARGGTQTGIILETTSTKKECWPLVYCRGHFTTTVMRIQGWMQH
jgi:hypothetical protein